MSEQPFEWKLGIPSSPTDLNDHSSFIPFWTSELEIGAKDKTFMHWFKEENGLEQELL
jgi:hypothetical protein